MLRGGSWNDNARNCRSAYRNRNAPDNRNDNIGFRPARAPDRRGSAGPDQVGVQGSGARHRPPKPKGRRCAGRRAIPCEGSLAADIGEGEMTVWLVQYRHEKGRSLEKRLAAGSVERWPSKPYGAARISREAEENDLVVIWRTIDQGRPDNRPPDNGGIVGWGRLRLERRLQSQPEIYFETTHAFAESPVPRHEVIAALREGGGVSNNWPGPYGLLRLHSEDESVVRQFYPNEESLEPMWHPLASGHPPDWASGWGQDEYGVFVEITVQDVSQRLRWCPPGRFLMGSPDDESQRTRAEGPQTEITFGKGFWLFETTVTQAFYHAVTQQEPSRFKGQGLPVENVSWRKAQDFLDAINDAHPGLDLRLPSEAEWEYACRAGSTTPFEPNVARRHAGMSITSDEVNHDGNYPYGEGGKGEYRAKTVAGRNAGFRPNKWGFWHMHGNLYEWCADHWHDDHTGAAPDGSPRQASQQANESSRVLRGGSWNDFARGCRSAYRRRLAPGKRGVFFGFRPARGQQGAQAGAAEPPSGSAESEA